MNLSGIDLNLLVVLDALLAESSVTAAARRVGLSQPAVSNALTRLRGLVGDPLFVRAGRGLVATPRARSLADPIRRALVEIGSALAPPAPFGPRQARRTFVLAMPDVAELVLMPPLSARLRREAPGIDLRVLPVPTAVSRDFQLGYDTPDLMIAMLNGLAPRAAPLFSLELVCLVRRDHPRVGARISLERFVELEHVLVAPGGMPGGIVDELLAKRGLERRVALTLAHFFSAAMVVSRSDLVMSATSVLAGIAERILPVRSVRHPLDTPVATIAQHWNLQHDADPAHRWLREMIAEVAARAVPRKARLASRSHNRRS
jgi:DNA-binding transcriptional LysR family regulator